MKITIVSCFHNSVELLPRYFRALLELDISGLECDGVFVDNASRDATGEQLRARAAGLSFPARVVSEQRPGLMYARCRAIEEADGDFVVFFDDDNEPRADYLQSLAALIRRHESAVAFTGNATLPDDYQVPTGLGRAVSMLAVRRVTGERVLTMDCYCPQPAPWGAGLAVKRKPMQEACRAWLSTAQVVVGRTGNNPLGGEEVWLLHHMTRDKEPVVFSDQLMLTHRIHKSRLTAEYLSRLGFEYGAIQPILADSVRKFKPELRFLYPDGVTGIAVALLRMLWAVTCCAFRPTAENLTFASGRLGLLLSMLRRHHKASAPNLGVGSE